MSVNRKLAAIMFSDIVGYTALMGSDEDHAFEVLRKNRDIHTKFISKYDGKLVKEMGDGMLAQFESAIDSVMCALEIQKEVGLFLDQKVRIGLHMGDVTIEHDDIFGDGVNLASRLQSIADPGGIYVSESIQKSIRAKSNLKTKYLGQFRLKNVSYPVNTYAILEDYLPVPTQDKIESLKGEGFLRKISKSPLIYVIVALLLLANGWWLKDLILEKKDQISSLLIFPIDNYTGADSLDVFFAGIHDALIGDMGKIGSLRVPSKRTANAYKDTDKSIPEIAKELDIDAAVEITVSCYGEEICFQARVISTYPEEKQLWVEDFYVERNQLSNLTKRVAKNISERLGVVLTPDQQQLLAESIPIKPDAYEAYLRGMSYWELGTKKDLDMAMSYFKLALEIEPDYALAHLGVSRVWGGYVQHGFLPNNEVVDKINLYRKKALELDSTLVEIRAGMATRNTWGNWDWEAGKREFLKAIEINPNYGFSQAYYSHFLAIMGDAEKGLPHSEFAMKNDPFNTLYQSVHGMALKNARKYEEALIVLQKLYASEPNQGIGLPALWAVYHELDSLDQALDIAMKIYALKEMDWAVETLESGNEEGGYKMAMQRMAEMMIKRSREEYYPPWQICTLYCRAKMKNEALDWLEKAYEEHDNNMPYISVDPLFDFVRDDPRFIDLLKKMKLPLSS